MLTAAAASPAYIAFETVRVVTGPGPTFLAPERDEAVISTYARLAYLLQFVGPDRVLVLPLLGLASIAWGVRARPVRGAAAAVAALVALESVELEALIPPLAAGVLLLCLSAVLVRVLLTAEALPPPPAEPDPSPEPAPAQHRTTDTPAGPTAEPDPPLAPLDPHAAYRRPATPGRTEA